MLLESSAKPPSDEHNKPLVSAGACMHPWGHGGGFGPAHRGCKATRGPGEGVNGGQPQVRCSHWTGGGVAGFQQGGG